MSATPRLPFPYRLEADIVTSQLQRLSGALDWAAAAQMAQPWVHAVRKNPPPFWAMESLLKEYPISSAEGLALMRLAEALLRVPDSETAIALTADQLGRADFDSAGNGVMARLSASAISCWASWARAVWLLRRCGLSSCWAGSLCSGSQLAMPGTKPMQHGKRQVICALATTCWAKARAPSLTRSTIWRVMLMLLNQ